MTVAEIVALVPDLMDRSRVSAALPEARFTRDPADCAGATVVLVDLARHAGEVAAVGGIGFTVALFVSDLTFHHLELDEAKMGVLGASLIAAVIGLTVLLVTLHLTGVMGPGLHGGGH